MSVPVTFHHGDALEVLRTLADNSIDSIVTDPPAGIAFMGKGWDGDKGGREQWSAWFAEIMREALRVVKPGGHALVWALPRTAHWTACGLEDAGWEIRDRITHVFATGFPKGQNISKAIDKAADYRLQAAVRRAAVTGVEAAGLTLPGNSRWDWTSGEHAPGNRWWATFLEWIPTLTDEDRERVEGEVLQEVHKTAGWFTSADIYNVTAPATDAAKQWEGWNTALKPAAEDWWLVRKPFKGTIAANVVEHGTGGLNIDATRVPAPDGVPEFNLLGRSDNVGTIGNGLQGSARTGATSTTGRWPANFVMSHGSLFDGTDACADGCVEGCPAAEMDQQSGVRPAGSAVTGSEPSREMGNWSGVAMNGGRPAQDTYGDTGGASRFFPVFRYQAKAPTRERPKVEGVAHPTVKPIALMRWLIRLITPPGGVVLDMFAGSGTTGEAALLEGFNCVLIEAEADYLPLIEQRIARAS